MKFEVFRGLSNLVFAPITIGDDGLEVWGKPQALAGVRSIETSVEEANDVVYFDNEAKILISSEGADIYNLTVSVPALSTRALLEGKKWDESKMAYLSTKTEKRYYAIGFKAAIVGDQNEDELYWIYKGKFSEAQQSYTTADNGSTHNTYSYTFTSLYTNRTFEGEPLKYIGIEGSHPMAADFLNYVFTPDKLSGTNLFTVDFDLSDATGSSGIGKRLNAAENLEYHKFIGKSDVAQKPSDFSFMGPWKGIHHRIRSATTGELLAVSGEDAYIDILRDPSMIGKYNLFSYVPTYWRKWDQKEVLGARHWVISISSTPFDGAEECGGTEYSAGRLGEGYVCEPGLTPLVSQSFNGFVGALADKPIEVITPKTYFDLLTLMWDETADLNSQRSVGAGITGLWWTKGIAIQEDATATHTVAITKTNKVHAGMYCSISNDDNFYSGSLFKGYVKAVDNTGANTILDFGEEVSITVTTINGIGFAGQPVSADDYLAMGDNTLGWVNNGGTEDANHVFVYGIADLWGNVWSWMNYQLRNNELFAEGVKVRDIAPEEYFDGYPTCWDWNGKALWATAYSGSSGILMSDYWYGKSAQDAPDRVCRFGGRWRNGGDAGAGCWNWLYSSGDPDVFIGCAAISRKR